MALAFDGTGAVCGFGDDNGKAVASVLMSSCFEMISSILGAMELRRFRFAAKGVGDADRTGDVDLSGGSTDGSFSGGGLCSLRCLSGGFSGESGINFSLFIVIFGAPLTFFTGVFFVKDVAGVEGVFFALAGDGGGVGNGRASVLMRMCFEMISSIWGAMEFRRFLFDAKLGVEGAGDTGDAGLSGGGGGGLCNLRRLSGDFSGIISSVFIVIFGDKVVALLFGF